jgi:hypothetical protein
MDVNIAMINADVITLLVLMSFVLKLAHVVGIAPIECTLHPHGCLDCTALIKVESNYHNLKGMSMFPLTPFDVFVYLFSFVTL